MKQLLLAISVASFAVSAGMAHTPPAAAPSPGEIVAAAPANDWTAIAASDLLVMDLAPDAQGKARRVVIQLLPAPFSQGWIGNIRKLAAAQWWDGTSVNRVQDNYVVQWGDATEKKPVPSSLVAVSDRDYAVSWENIPLTLSKHTLALLEPGEVSEPMAGDWRTRDAYTNFVDIIQGWPIASDWPVPASPQAATAWPVHCYAMVGVGRNLSPDTGSGAELYTVIGHAPRHLDRNIALVGRVIEGIGHLSSLPRGTGALGFYESAAERVPIVSVRIGTGIADLPVFEYLTTASMTFAAYADARANRRDPFFNVPAGGADICNIPVPVRRKTK